MNAIKESVGIIGFGNMGAAIAEGIKRDYQVTVFEKDPAKTVGLSLIHNARTLEELFERSGMVILAVKPQELGELLEESRDKLSGKLVVSIAAGVPSGLIEQKLGAGCRVVRVMPNLPAKIAKGMICLCAGSAASAADLQNARKIFAFLGETVLVEEKMMNAVTAVSGSGPGYLYYLLENTDRSLWAEFIAKSFVPSLSKAAVMAGFDPGDAAVLSAVTAEGSLALLERSGLSPAVLRAQVTSKGGTTEAGIAAMRESGNSLQAAVQAAVKRAEELSRDLH